MQPHTHSTRTRPATLSCSQMSATGGGTRVSSSLTSSRRTRAHSASPSMPGELILDLTICSSHLAGVGAASSPCPASLLFALCSFLGWGSIIGMYLCSQLHTHWHTRAHRLPLCDHWKPILLQWSEAFTSGCVNTESNKPVRAAQWACWSGRRRLLKHSALDMENKACHQFWEHARVSPLHCCTMLHFKDTDYIHLVHICIGGVPFIKALVFVKIQTASIGGCLIHLQTIDPWSRLSATVGPFHVLM